MAHATQRRRWLLRAELDAAEQRLGLKLPLALREWYQLAGQREDVIALYNHLVCPANLEVTDGLLVFHSENQDVIEWGIKLQDLVLPAPPVYLNDSGYHDEPQEPIRENKTLPEFALQMVFCDTVVARDRSISARNIDKSTIARVEQEYIRFDFPEWHWPSYPVHFFGTEDTLGVIVGEGQRDIYVAARTHTAYVTAEELLKPR